MKKFLGVALAAFCLLLPTSVSADSIYTNCLYGCEAELNSMEANLPGVRKILNYYAQPPPMSQAARLSYAQTAAANEEKIIWPIPGNWSCNGPDWPNVADVVDFYENLPATWGYYIGEEGASVPCAGTIKAHDPNHPRLYVDGPRSSSRLQASDIARFRSYADEADRLGVECYPIKSSGAFPPSQCGNEVQKLRDALPSEGIWAVGQAFSWSDTGSQTLTGPYPSYSEQCAMRSATAPKVSTVLWFDYLYMTGSQANHAPANAVSQLSNVIGDPACG